MCKAGLTEVLAVIDKSGSMAGLAEEWISGFNYFLREQRRLPGECRLTLTMFDTSYNVVYTSYRIQDVPILTPGTYRPYGGTALLDAVGRTIAEAGDIFDRRPEWDKPEKVIMVIMTDGEENSSREYNRAAIKALTEQQQRDWKWQFVYLGANQDSFAEAGSIGIPMSNIANFRPTGQSVAMACCAMNASVTNYRATGDASLGDTQY